MFSTVLSSSVSAGIPNITGSWATHAWNDAPSGAVAGTGSTKKAGTSNDSNSKPVGKNFNASRCSSLYGASTTVTPLSRKCVFLVKF